MIFQDYSMARFHMEINKREDIGDVLEQLGLRYGAELGVQRGEFSFEILTRWHSVEKYSLVDLWAHQSGGLYLGDKANVDSNEQLQIMKDAQQRLKSFGNRVEFIQNFTSNASLMIPDDSLDFVYVDARHDYCGVKEDIEKWWPKLKVGGLMAGHDYLTNQAVKRIDKDQDWSTCFDGITKNESSVKGAVDEFAALHNITVYHTLPKYNLWVTWIYEIKKKRHLLLR